MRRPQFAFGLRWVDRPPQNNRRGHSVMSGFDIERTRTLAGKGNASDVSEVRDRLIRKANQVRSLVRAASAFQIPTAAYFRQIQRTKALLAARSYRAALVELERLEVDLLRVFVGRIAVDRQSKAEPNLASTTVPVAPIAESSVPAPVRAAPTPAPTVAVRSATDHRPSLPVRRVKAVRPIAAPSRVARSVREESASRNRHLARRATYAALLIGVMALAAVSIPTTYAVHDDKIFELGPGVNTDEGGKTNILGDGNALNGPDWADIFGSTGNVVDLHGGLAAAFLKDDLSQSGAVDRTTFSGAGGSNKNNDPIAPPGDTWHWDTGNTPAKDDLSNVYAWATISPAGDQVIYAGFERLDPSGDSHIDVELFQAQVRLNGSNDAGFCTYNLVDKDNGCHFNGTRTNGDVIVSMDFLTGGALGSVSVRQWSGSSYGSAVVTLSGEGCNPADTICAFNNGGSINGGPWPNFDRHGTEITNLPKNAFTEFGLDVTALLSETPCLSTILGKTRSSQSFTAELKDFDGPLAFPICNATIAMTPNDVNEINQPHTFTVWVNKTAGGISSPAQDGTIVTVTLTPTNGASVSLLSDNCASPGTVGGKCTVTFTSPSAGVVTGSAVADVNVQGFIFHVATDGKGSNSGPATKVFVDASIAIGPSAANEVGTPHTFTVTVKANSGDGAGFVPATVGHVSFTLTDSNGAVSSLNAAASTCDDVGDNLDALGQCTIVFTSNDAGLVTGHASVMLDVLGVSLTRSTNGISPNSADSIKRFVDASITITPPGVNEVGDPHTFTVTVMQDDGSGSGFVAATVGHVSFTLTDSGGASHVLDPAASTCDDTGDNLDASGQCTIVFTSNSAGTVTGHATVTLSVAGVPLIRSTDGEAPNSGDVEKA